MRNMNFVFEKIHVLKLLRNIMLRGLQAPAMYVQLVCLWHQWIHGCANSPLGQPPKTCAKLFILHGKPHFRITFKLWIIWDCLVQREKGKKMANNKRSSNGLGWPFVVPPPAFILEQLKLCGDSFENSHWSNVAGQGLWLDDPRWAPPNVGPM